MKTYREMLTDLSETIAHELAAVIGAEEADQLATNPPTAIVFLHSADGGRVAITLHGALNCDRMFAQNKVSEIWAPVESRPLVELVKKDEPRPGT